MTDMRLVPIRPLLQRAVDAMEAIYGLMVPIITSSSSDHFSGEPKFSKRRFQKVAIFRFHASDFGCR